MHNLPRTIELTFCATCGARNPKSRRDGNRYHLGRGGSACPGKVQTIVYEIRDAAPQAPVESVRDLRTHVGGGLYVKPLGHITPDPPPTDNA